MNNNLALNFLIGSLISSDNNYNDDDRVRNLELLTKLKSDKLANIDEEHLKLIDKGIEILRNELNE